MLNNKLHIVSFDVPYPPDYGGAIDVYYKLKALKETGVEIYLHCFDYGRQESDELQKLCDQVLYYKRDLTLRSISLTSPYIVNSRRNTELLNNLSAIDAPILFEGLHTTYHLSNPLLNNRKKAIRIHNIESEYYKQLATKEKNLFRKLYYRIESALLGSYERTLSAADAFFSLSMADDARMAKIYPSKKHQFIAPFHPYTSVVSSTGKGDYCLYHGNLSHPENIEAVLFLLNTVFNQTQIPLVIAGRKPTDTIRAACTKLSHIKLVADPTNDEMHKLIAEAHVHILPTFQESGMKLKLLYALFNGRHVIATHQMLTGTGLDELCHIANTSETMINCIHNLMQQTFTEDDISEREALLRSNYSNTLNAQKIITWMQE